MRGYIDTKYLSKGVFYAVDFTDITLQEIEDLIQEGFEISIEDNNLFFISKFEA